MKPFFKPEDMLTPDMKDYNPDHNGVSATLAAQLANAKLEREGKKLLNFDGSVAYIYFPVVYFPIEKLSEPCTHPSEKINLLHITGILESGNPEATFECTACGCYVKATKWESEGDE